MKIIFDITSQPSRAILTLCEIENIPFEKIEVNLALREHLSPELKKINPSLKVPVLITNDNFVIFESHAIMKYLCY